MEEPVNKGGRATMIKNNTSVHSEFARPATPEMREDKRKDKDGGSERSDGHKQARLQGKKRHRRGKGKRKKQKTSLMITNDDGTHSTTSQESAHQQRKVCLRPSNNPLLKAPKNSTQYIIDDHENSNLFVDFGDERSNEAKDPADEEPYFGINEADRLSPDDDNFFTEYAERDFESVYATAHQEEVSSWEREKIIEEIGFMEWRQKQLVEVLRTIDPTVNLQKLQHDLLSLQEVNRQLKLRIIAERLERQQMRDRRGMSRHSSPPLPDSTTNLGEEESGSSASSSSSQSEGESDGGGCSSGCCLADDCEEKDKNEVKMDEGRGKEDASGKKEEVVENKLGEGVDEG